MTTCPTCQNEMPELALACPTCMRTRYLSALERNEIALLPAIVNGDRPIKLLKTAKQRPPHIAYQDGFSKEAYCRIELRGTPRIDYYSFADRPKLLCRTCVSTLKTYLKKAGLEHYAGQVK